MPMKSSDESQSASQELQAFTVRSLSEYLEVILKHRKTIGKVVFISFFLSIIISLLWPKMYEATARVMPPQESNPGIFSLLDSSEDQLSGLARSLIGAKTPADLYVGIMKSRSVADALNQKFNLKELYGKKYIEDVYSKLEDRTTIEASKKDQIIIVSVNDRDPQRAADMANTYIAMLDQINRKLYSTKGKRKRLFLESRLKEVRTDLDKAESDLKAFQEKFHIIAIEEQAKVAIEGAAEIKAQIIEAQTDLGVYKQFGTEKQPEAVMLKAKIEELQKQLESIEKNKGLQNNDSDSMHIEKGSDFYLPFADLPRLGMRLMQLTREAKIQGKLFELLTAQYEMARIEEANDVDTIQVLDKAVAPEKKISPKRVRIILILTILSFLTAVTLIAIKESNVHITL